MRFLNAVDRFCRWQCGRDGRRVGNFVGKAACAIRSIPCRQLIRIGRRLNTLLQALDAPSGWVDPNGCTVHSGRAGARDFADSKESARYDGGLT